jgi:hypothetical protein
MGSSPSWTAPGQQQTAPNDPFASLRSGSLVVWQSGQASYLGWPTIQKELSAEFPQLQVTFRLLPAEDFVAALALAQEQGSLPDAVFVDNWSQGAALVAQQSVMELMGPPRFVPSRGWWFLMQQATHPAAAASFVYWLQDDPHRRPRFTATLGQTEQDKLEIIAVARNAIQASAGCIGPENIFDRDAANFSESPGTNCPGMESVSNVSLFFLYGNPRIAYTDMGYDALIDKNVKGTPVRIGILHSFVVLRKGEQGWRALLLSPVVSTQAAMNLASRFNLLKLSTEISVAPGAPTLLAPSNGDQQDRFPRQDIVWQQGANRPAVYIVEAQFTDPRGIAKYWSDLPITFVDPSRYGDVVRMPMPFGIGKQPHRWRVWAVGKDGQIALSEWRTILFTN